jgi:hypothetical protein
MMALGWMGMALAALLLAGLIALALMFIGRTWRGSRGG